MVDRKIPKPPTTTLISLKINMKFTPYIRILRLATLCVLAVCLVWSPRIMALSNDYEKLLNKGIYYFDPAADSASACESNFSGSNNPEIAFNFFLSKNLTPRQTAGIIGNLMVEAPGLDPNTKQLGGGPGRGIAQWTLDERWQVLLDFAEAHKKDPLTLVLQLEFIWFEMTGEPPTPGVTGANRPILDELKKAKTIEEAVEIFLTKFEGASIPNTEDRIDEAYKAFNLYGNNSVVSDGCSGVVNAEGYAFPLEGTQSQVSAYTSLPCLAGPNGCHHDGTPAFDLHHGSGNATVGKKVYAIHDGVIESLRNYREIAFCVSIQLRQTGSNNPDDDGWHYWYGHITKPTVKEGQKVSAGQQIAEVGNSDCATSAQTHLHIDRGSPKGHLGGYDDSRDPGIIGLINTLYQGLPE